MATSIITTDRVTWTNIVRPTQADIDELGQRYPQLHPLNLGDCLTPAEFPKLDHYDDYLFIVTQFPRWDAASLICHPAEVDIFITRGVLITSHQGELKPLNTLFARLETDPQARQELMAHGASPLLYELLSVLVNYCYPILQKVNHNIRQIEQNLFGADTPKILHDVAIARRDVIALRHIIRPQIDVMRELEKGQWDFIHEDLNLYWSDISDHLAQLRLMADEYGEVIGGLSDTLDTLASHRIDEVVRLLTLVTLLSLPLTILTTIFGMNVYLPQGSHPLTFYVINGIGIFITVFLVWRLRRLGRL